MTTIATICARGGSQGLPGKNIKPLCGRPMIAHSIQQALECPHIGGVYVSTDSEEIAAVARAFGAIVLGLRPKELATSCAPKIPVIQHLVSEIEKTGVEVSRIVDLDPTSPLRIQEDIEACLSLLSEEVDVVITGYQAEKNPYFNMMEVKSDGRIGLVMEIPGGVFARQAAPPVFAMNASIYVWHRRTLELGVLGGRIRLHEMPRERSIDVDSRVDFLLVELLMADRAGGRA